MSLALRSSGMSTLTKSSGSSSSSRLYLMCTTHTCHSSTYKSTSYLGLRDASPTAASSSSSSRSPLCCWTLCRTPETGGSAISLRSFHAPPIIDRRGFTSLSRCASIENFSTVYGIRAFNASVSSVRLYPYTYMLLG